MAELGGDHPVVPPLADGGADERLGQVIAVALSGVDQVHPQLVGAAQELVHLRLGEASSPFAAPLPGPNPDH